MADHPLWVLMTATALGSAILVSVAGVVLLRRRTWPYLFITVAIGMLVVRAAVGFLTLAGVVAVDLHHYMEHSIDLFAILALFAAIYFARTSPPTRSDIDVRDGRRSP